MIKFVIIMLAGLALLGAALFRKKRKPTIFKSYTEGRRQIIRELADPHAPLPPPRQRPKNLDCRLAASVGQDLRDLWPQREDCWKELYNIQWQITKSIVDELAAIDSEHHRYELLSAGRRAMILAHDLELEVNNGGFEQYYLNSAGDGAYATPAALRFLGIEELAQLVEKANGLFPSGPSPVRAVRLAQLEGLPDAASQALDELTDGFFQLETPNGGFCFEFGMAYVLENEDEFFRPNG